MKFHCGLLLLGISFSLFPLPPPPKLLFPPWWPQSFPFIPITLPSPNSISNAGNSNVLYYDTTYNDLSILYSFMKNKKKTIVCDDYIDASYITEVKKAVDDFVRKNNLKFQVIKGKFVLIET